MRRSTPLLLLLAVVLTIMSWGATASAMPEVAGRAVSEKQERVLVETSAERSIRSQGRVKGVDGRGIYVFSQVRKCGVGKWKNSARVTTTADRGRYNFDVAGKPALMRKYKYKEYKVKFYALNQFRLFIPATDKYKAVSIPSQDCLG